MNARTRAAQALFGLTASVAFAVPTVATAQAKSLRPARIAFVTDAPGSAVTILETFEAEIRHLLKGEFQPEFLERSPAKGAHSFAGARRVLSEVLADPSVDVVVTLGVFASHEASLRGPLPKPLVAPIIVDTEAQGLPQKDGATGVRNFVYIARTTDLTHELEVFREVVSFRKIALLIPLSVVEVTPAVHLRVEEATRSSGVDAVLVPVGESIQEAIERLPKDTDAAYVTPMWHLPRSEFDVLVQELIARRLPSFAPLARQQVEAGILVGLAPDDSWHRLARRTALNVQRALLGEDPGTFAVALSSRERLTINLATARAIGIYPPWRVLTEAELLYEEAPETQRRLTLKHVATEALELNLDLRARQHDVAARAQNIRIARSNLLPHVDLTAEGVVIDDDRARAARGSAPERTMDASATLSQLIYDEAAWADLSIRKREQQAVEYDRDALRLDVVLEVSQAYLDVLRAETLRRIQRDNLRVTRSNLELARMRRSVGYSGPAEVYRWESQIANDRQAVIDAGAQTGLARIELNRLLHRPPEEPFSTEKEKLEELGLIYTDPNAARYIANPWLYGVFTDFVAEEALRVAPEIRRLDALIEAQERVLGSARRDFFTPNLAFQGSVKRHLHESGAGSDLSPADDHDFTAGLRLKFPVFEGGLKLAVHVQALENLSRLRVERSAVAERVEQRVRSALISTGAAFVSIALSRQSADAARSNYDLVSDAYARGAVSILDLLDAQNAALVADQTAANAEFDFLKELMATQRAAGWFDFFTTDQERAGLLERLERFYEQAQAGRKAP